MNGLSRYQENTINRTHIKLSLYMSIMNRFPLEIVNRILEYDGRIKYRHGKYMNQIHKDDYRYNLLRKISIFRRDYWYSGFYVYQIHYNNGNSNASTHCLMNSVDTTELKKKHMMIVYIFEDYITYLYINKECVKYNALR